MAETKSPDDDANTNGNADENDGDDRMVKDVLAPPRFPIAHDILFPQGDVAGGIGIDALIQHLNAEGRLSMDDALLLVNSTAELFGKEPNLLRLKDPITVCGDVHGQFFDFLRLLEAGGDPATTQYLFLGDYVDRGCFATECVFLLCAYKLMYPTTFFMLRGNHECRHLTAFFNFKDECMYKYDLDLYDAIMSMFDYLPIAATVNGKFLCVHGGLSPDISTLQEISDIDRVQEVPREGPFCDLLWADPVDEDKNGDEEDEDEDDVPPTTWFSYNNVRQCSYQYGVDAVKTFLKKNNLTAIIRAHEAQFDGYKMQMINTTTQIPRVITIFSAPNYCDVYKNKGACLKFDDELLNIRQFVSSDHPYYLPNFMDVFTWSLPFVAEKVTDMLYSILSYQGTADPDENATVAISGASQDAKRGLKQKVVAVTKVMRMYRVLKENQQKIVQLKQLSPNGKIPLGVLAGGTSSIERAISSFNNARAADLVNEAIPGKPKRKVSHETFYYADMDKSVIADDSTTDKDGHLQMKITQE